MKAAVVTGAGGLVGSAAVEKLVRDGYFVVCVENDMRRYFFGKEGTTQPTLDRLVGKYGDSMSVQTADIRDYPAIRKAMQMVSNDLELVFHAAAQPSHDWAAREPHTDFGVNALGTLNVLEAVRQVKPEATVACISTSKVYGDRPNELPLIEKPTRLDLRPQHEYHEGIKTRMSIDRCLHSLFGASKVAGDIVAQEYGRYFDMPVLILRPGCVTGPAHAGVELHGFLAYLMKCALEGKPYTIYGYGGKQVRCNIHAEDLVDCCLAYHANPSSPGMVYNIGGGRASACSVLEAIEAIERITGLPLDFQISDEARIGDHMWWISDIARFQRDYPEWKPRDLDTTLRQMHEGMTS